MQSDTHFSTGFTPVSPDGPRPPWLKLRISADAMLAATRDRLHSLNLNTVCESAACPNIGHCWKCGHATIMILGANCTRHCRFCNVAKNKVLPPDPDEPERVARAVKASGLSGIVITSVTRDDLPDGGAAHWAETVRAIRRLCPSVTQEILVPDFKGDANALETVFAAKPDIFSHNVETVPRLYPSVRPEAIYARSLEVLRAGAKAGFRTKTSLMLGLGETDDEIYRTLRDIRDAGVDTVFMGQYLRPSSAHIPVAGYLSPEHFAALGDAARALGFTTVESAPFIRSSYR